MIEMRGVDRYLVKYNYFRRIKNKGEREDINKIFNRQAEVNEKTVTVGL